MKHNLQTKKYRCPCPNYLPVFVVRSKTFHVYILILFHLEVHVDEPDFPHFNNGYFLNGFKSFCSCVEVKGKVSCYMPGCGPEVG